MADFVLSAVLRLRDEMSNKLKGMASNIAGLSSKVNREISKGAAGISKGAAGLGQSINRLNTNLSGGDLARLERLKGVLEAAGMQRPIDLRARDNASSKINKIKQELQNLVGKKWEAVVNIKDNAKAALSKTRGEIGEFASGMAMGMGAGILGTAGIGYGVVNAVESQMNFEKQMSAVKSIYSGSFEGENLNRVTEMLTKAAEHAGATTQFTAKEAGEALYYFGMAGWNPERAAAGLMPTLNLAAAGDEQLGTTADIVSDAMTAFGLKAGTYIKNSKGQMVEASQMFADLMGATVTHANTTIGMMGETLKYAASPVGAMYADQTDEDRLKGAQDTMLLTGLMANAGIKSSQAGTSIRSFFAREGAENRNAFAAAQEALGVAFSDEKTGKVRRIKDIFGDLRKRFQEGLDAETLIDFEEYLSKTKIHKDTRRKLESMLKSAQEHGGALSGADKLKMASMINGQEGMSGLLAVLTASEEDWNKINDALDSAEGTVEAMAKIRMDNLWGDLKYLGSAWDAFQRNLVKGDASAGLREFTQAMTDTFTKANKLFEDGIDFGDFGKIIIDVIAKLKSKFLELDGIGSLLAGGALIMGMRKILSMALKVKDTLSTWSKVRTATDVGNILRGGAAGTGGLQSVGAMNVNASTMNVRAGVVNLNGAIRGGTGGTVLGGAGGAAGRGGVGGVGGRSGAGGVGGAVGRAGIGGLGGVAAVLTATQIAQQKAERSALAAKQAQARADSLIAAAWARPAESGKLLAQHEKASQRAAQAQLRAQQEAAHYAQLRTNDERAAAYYSRREAYNLQQRYAADVAAAQQEAMAQKYARRREIAGTAAGGAALGAVFGIMDVAATRASGAYNLDQAKETLTLERNELKNLRDQGADISQINSQIEKISQAEENVKQISETNAINERRAGAGAAGMIAGTAIGAAVGSFVPFIGNMLGGMLGGIIGQKIGEYAADNISTVDTTSSVATSTTKTTAESSGNHVSMGDFRYDNDPEYVEQQRKIQEEQQERQRKIQEAKDRAYSEEILKKNAANISARSRERRISLETDVDKRNELRAQDAAIREEVETQKEAARKKVEAEQYLHDNHAWKSERRDLQETLGYRNLFGYGGDKEMLHDTTEGWADSRGTCMKLAESSMEALIIAHALTEIVVIISKEL